MGYNCCEYAKRMHEAAQNAWCCKHDKLIHFWISVTIIKFKLIYFLMHRNSDMNAGNLGNMEKVNWTDAVDLILEGHQHTGIHISEKTFKKTRYKSIIQLFRYFQIVLFPFFCFFLTRWKLVRETMETIV